MRSRAAAAARWYYRLNRRIFEAAAGALRPWTPLLAVACSVSSLWVDGFWGWYLVVAGLALMIASFVD